MYEIKEEYRMIIIKIVSFETLGVACDVLSANKSLVE